MVRIIRIAIISALVLLHVAFGIPGWLHPGQGSYLLRAATYSFFHASWWHLAVNCLAVWTIFDPKRGCKPCRDLIFPFIIAMAVYPLALRPVVGFSNILYAVLGIRTPSLRSRWWRQWPVALFLAVTVAMVFVPTFSATTHIASFALGVAAAAAGRSLKPLLDDVRRYL